LINRPDNIKASSVISKQQVAAKSLLIRCYQVNNKVLCKSVVINFNLPMKTILSSIFLHFPAGKHFLLTKSVEVKQLAKNKSA
jgi:hypothetical protein